MVRLYPLRRRRRNPKLRPLLKWITPFTLLFPSCDVLEPHIVEVPVIWELRDTIYVQQTDTLYVANPAKFGIATQATLQYAIGDTVECVYQFHITKLDRVPVDSLWVYGVLIEWDLKQEKIKIMDSTRTIVWPDNAGSWSDIYAYSFQELTSNNRWHTDDWPSNRDVKYSMGLEYK